MKMESVLSNTETKDMVFNDQATLFVIMFYVLILKIGLFIISVAATSFLFITKPDFFGYYLVVGLFLVWSIKMLVDYREYFRYFLSAFVVIYTMLLHYSDEDNVIELNKFLSLFKHKEHSDWVKRMLVVFKQEGLDDGIIK
jgi:hypothetical protein